MFEDEFGYISMDELNNAKGKLGIGMERDTSFPVGVYTVADVVSGKVSSKTACHVVEEDGKYVVKAHGKTLGTHDTKPEADAQVRAVHAKTAEKPPYTCPSCGAVDKFSGGWGSDEVTCEECGKSFDEEDLPSYEPPKKTASDLPPDKYWDGKGTYTCPSCGEKTPGKLTKGGYIICPSCEYTLDESPEPKSSSVTASMLLARPRRTAQQSMDNADDETLAQWIFNSGPEEVTAAEAELMKRGKFVEWNTSAFLRVMDNSTGDVLYTVTATDGVKTAKTAGVWDDLLGLASNLWDAVVGLEALWSSVKTAQTDATPEASADLRELENVEAQISELRRQTKALEARRNDLKSILRPFFELADKGLVRLQGIIYQMKVTTSTSHHYAAAYDYLVNKVSPAMKAIGEKLAQGGTSETVDFRPVDPYGKV
jgi:uncharacterized Zn finger protein (UPF0148 family)